jgi:hypothetical protein
MAFRLGPDGSGQISPIKKNAAEIVRSAKENRYAKI